jgi:hypothetical protein
MDERYVTAGVTVLLGIIGVAVLALLVSRASQTSSVISAGSGGFACVLKTALTGVDHCAGDRGTNVNSTITFGGF